MCITLSGKLTRNVTPSLRLYLHPSVEQAQHKMKSSAGKQKFSKTISALRSGMSSTSTSDVSSISTGQRGYRRKCAWSESHAHTSDENAATLTALKQNSQPQLTKNTGGTSHTRARETLSKSLPAECDCCMNMIENTRMARSLDGQKRRKHSGGHTRAFSQGVCCC